MTGQCSFGSSEDALDQRNQIVMAEPCRQHAVRNRLRRAGADTNDSGLQAELVVVAAWRTPSAKHFDTP